MLKIGLTGGIGAGKSEVSRLFAAHGAVIVDSDLIAREVVAPGTDGLAAVVAEFGPQVLREDGTLDRPALGAIVFADPEKLRALNAIVVHDVPLLTENGLAPLFDLVVVVDADDEVRVERLVRLRGMAEEEARARMAAQASRADRLAIADLVIDNGGPLEALTARVDEVWAELVKRAAA